VSVELQIYMVERGEIVLTHYLIGSSGEKRVMKHVKITAFDCPDAWFQALRHIWNEGDTFHVDYGSEETETKKLNLTIEVKCPETRPLVSDKAPCDIKYIRGYALEYLWCGEKQDETYTYGSRLNYPINQISEAVDPRGPWQPGAWPRRCPPARHR